jgi:hypothetical protein
MILACLMSVASAISLAITLMQGLNLSSRLHSAMASLTLSSFFFGIIGLIWGITFVAAQPAPLKLGAAAALVIIGLVFNLIGTITTFMNR